MELTREGQTVYRHASDILSLYRQITSLGGPKEQTVIRLGASTIPSAYVLPQLLPEFGRFHLDIIFTIHQNNSQKIAKRIVDGLFDAGLVGMEGDDQLRYIPFCKDRIILITPAIEPYLTMHRLSEPPLAELLTHPIILREKTSGSQNTADRFLESLGMRENQLHIIARIDDQEAIKNLVASGFEVSLLSERAAENAVMEKQVLKFDLPDHNVRDPYLAHRTDDILPPHIEEFLSFAKSKFAVK